MWRYSEACGDGALLEAAVMERYADRATIKGRGRKTNWNRKSDNTGFMDFQKERVIALRDRGGLAWGGADFESGSGDMQHFEPRTEGSSLSLRDAIRRVKRKAKAAGH